MQKHAYLIIAHNNFEQLAMLLETLDYPYNDIFIHIDKKSVFDPAPLISAVGRLQSEVQHPKIK